MSRVLSWAYSSMPQGVEHDIVCAVLRCFNTVYSIDAIRRYSSYYIHLEKIRVGVILITSGILQWIILHG
jgi:hypothetical protein